MVLHGGRQRQSLAAGAGCEVQDLLTGLGAGEECSKLRALVLNFDGAFEKRRFGVNRRALCIRRKPNAQADRRPPRRFGVKMRELRQCFITLAFERIGPQIKRRPARERCALGCALIAEHARKMRVKPVWVITQNVGRRTSERAAGERLALGLRQLLWRKARSAAECRNLFDIKTTLAM